MKIRLKTEDGLKLFQNPIQSNPIQNPNDFFELRQNHFKNEMIGKTRKY